MGETETPQPKESTNDEATHMTGQSYRDLELDQETPHVSGRAGPGRPGQFPLIERLPRPDLEQKGNSRKPPLPPRRPFGNYRMT